MTCWVCDQIRAQHPEEEPTHDSFHEVCLEWARAWAGPQGWARKQALARAKKEARMTAKRVLSGRANA